MQESRRVITSAGVIFFAYVALLWSLIRGPLELEPILWMCSPLALPLIVILTARKQWTRRVSLNILLCLSVVGSLGLVGALIWDKTDYSYLIFLLLPLYQFGFLALVMAALGLAALLRRGT